MPKGTTIAAAACIAVLTALPVAAQDAGGQGGAGPGQEQGQTLPPSAAVRLAVDAVPGAQPLGVKLRGGAYVVRLKQDGTVIQVAVDAVTGEVMPLR